MDIAQTLIRHGLVSRQQIDSALPQVAGRRLDRALIELGLVNEDEVLKAFAEELGMPFIEVKQESIDHDLLMQFPTTAVFRHSLLPINRRNGTGHAVEQWGCAAIESDGCAADVGWELAICRGRHCDGGRTKSRAIENHDLAG